MRTRRELRRRGEMRRSALLVSVLCVASFVAGAGIVSAGRPDARPRPAAISGVIPLRTDGVADRQREVAGVLAEHYYRPVDATRLAGTPVANLAKLLDDPYTQYLDPAHLAAFQLGDTGQYAGIGIHARLVGGDVILDRVSSGGPAAAANLHPGDVVISANGKRLHGLDLESALGKIRGRVGTTVTLRVRHGKRTRTLVLRLAEVKAQIVSHQLRKEAGTPVGYIQVLDFSRDVGQQVRSAMKDLDARNATRVVLDLRHNGGGLVDEAVELTSVFTAIGTPVFIESGRHVATRTYSTQTAPSDLTTPLAVLVDDQSASAAEIVAGALRDAGRATIIGTKTFGKGVIQDLVNLNGGGALKYTMAEYLTPTGQHVDRLGISPDFRVATPAVHGEVDRALDTAYRILKARPS
ncbi:MAG: carboxyl-terminal processing protease [Actinomycetota bacterium]|nr:carboxyl-terminal processing protease [Actinomycetota bacterium]